MYHTPNDRKDDSDKEYVIFSNFTYLHFLWHSLFKENSRDKADCQSGHGENKLGLRVTASWYSGLVFVKQHVQATGFIGWGENTCSENLEVR